MTTPRLRLLRPGEEPDLSAAPGVSFCPEIVGVIIGTFLGSSRIGTFLALHPRYVAELADPQDLRVRRTGGVSWCEMVQDREAARVAREAAPTNEGPGERHAK